MKGGRDDTINHHMDALRYLAASLEAGLYGAKQEPQMGLFLLLAKLNVKSARNPKVAVNITLNGFASILSDTEESLDEDTDK